MPTYNNPRLRRLAREQQLLTDFCNQASLVSYQAINQRSGMPPEHYQITYKVRSIIGIASDQMPIYGERHVAEIIIPPSFPMADQPKCTMLTPVWHPNIKFGGDFSGRICINAEALGHWHTLDMLAERIGEMLQYKNYHAENIAPHPEDAKVAAWVRDFAEPKIIINKKKKIYTDSRPLIQPSKEWLETRKEKIQITINGISKSQDKDEDYSRYFQIVSKRKQITVTLKDKP